MNMHIIASLAFITTLTNVGVNSELVAVVQLFRHGQRTPTSFYTNDTYQSSSYWGGLSGGQLTNEGKRQHFTLGQYTRSRYSSFIPTKYNSSFFYAKSTDVDRTHMSAQSNIYGLYPAKTTDQVWRKNVDWQAVPVHPADSEVWSSAFFLSDCAAYSTLLANVLNSDEIEELDETYLSLYTYLTENTGTNVTSFTETNSIWDSLKVEDSVGYKLPSWTKSVYPEPLRTLVGKFFALSTYTSAMKRFIIGPFLNEVVEYLEGMAEDPTSSYRFKMYSGHDTNIAATLNAFGAFDPPFPPAFASSIYIELHKENWQFYVKVFSKDGDTLKQINVNGCDSSCLLTEFREKLGDYLVDATTRDTECTATEESTTVSTARLLSAAPNSGRYTGEDIIEEWRNYSN